MKRFTQKHDGIYYIEQASLSPAPNGFSGDGADRLATFENIFESLQKEQMDISQQLEALRGMGKEKTVKFKELMVKKLTNTNLLATFDFWGIK